MTSVGDAWCTPGTTVRVSPRAFVTHRDGVQPDRRGRVGVLSFQYVLVLMMICIIINNRTSSTAPPTPKGKDGK